MDTNTVTLTRSPYEILKVNPWADVETIKAQYFHLVKQYNPEYYPEEFIEIRTAFDILKEPASRAASDVENFSPPPSFSHSDYKGMDLHSISLFKLNQEMKTLCGERQLEQLEGEEKAKALHLLHGAALYHSVHSHINEAKEVWNKIIDLYPDDQEAKSNLTYTVWQEAFDLAADGQMEEAENAFKQLNESGFKNAAIYKNVALAQEKQGKKDESRESWKIAIDSLNAELKNDPDNDYIKALVIAAHKYTGGYHLEGKSEVDGSEGNITAGSAKELGYACIKQGNWRQALEALERARQDNEQDVDVLCQLAWAYLNTNQHKVAFQTWNHALKIASSKQGVIDHLVRGHTIFGKRLMEQRIFNQALVQFKNALKHEPKNFELRLLLGETYFQMRNFTSALAEYQRVMDVDPRNKVARQGVRECKRLGGLR
ncbi:MAG: tetratricopeptide repeat protein [Candidatus Hinthialibacter antarcticus]|nr:tetratricopeptide repeat protein [Candidatus Hinthialibacter antarcticus]